MIDSYLLMHKNNMCGIMGIDRDSGTLLRFDALDKRYTPFLGNADERLMKIWWNHRAVPGSRKEMETVIRREGCESNLEYLAKNLALSITDTYWICPADIELSWEDINLHSSASGSRNVVTYHNADSYDPNASLGGQMSKYWDLTGNTPVLVKKASEYYGQQSINELFAAEVHRRQNPDVPYVRYTMRESPDNTVLSCCDAFTSESVEFVSAYELLRSRKLRKNRSDYDQIIDICEENGIERSVMQRFMDYLVLTDFAISNTDEHLQNFGVLRDADTMKLIGPAPIFDSGNSMFFSEFRDKPFSRIELLEREISSLHNNEEKMLRHVSNRNAIDYEKLPDSEEVLLFYRNYGLPEEKSRFIAGSYKNKLTLLKDFMEGSEVSLFTERSKKQP